jgi:hypothetical protein
VFSNLQKLLLKRIILKCIYSVWIVHVKWVPCHNGMTRPQVADTGDGLQIWIVAANILNKKSWTADRG